MSAHYDDPNFFYEKYWEGRDYENTCEVIAIDTLLVGKSFKVGVDIGGGYGRLTSVIGKYCRKMYLIEPSVKQRKIAVGRLKKVEILSGTIQRTGFKAGTVDLAVLVRVMHHVLDTDRVGRELEKIVRPGGYVVLEFANSIHFKARIMSWINGQPILPIPVERRSVQSIHNNTIEFVNHHPYMIKKMLVRHGFEIEKILSVSNLRWHLLKIVLPMRVMLWLEKMLQSALGSLYFGPSIFILAKRLD